MSFSLAVKPPTIQLDRKGNPLTGLKNHNNGQHSLCWEGFRIGGIAFDKEHMCHSFQLLTSKDAFNGTWEQCVEMAERELNICRSHPNSQGPVVLLKVDHEDTKEERLRHGWGAQNYRRVGCYMSTMVTVMDSSGEMFDIPVPASIAAKGIEGWVYDHRYDAVTETHTLGDIKA